MSEHECEDKKRVEALEKEVSELKETILAQQKQIADLQAELSGYKKPAKNSNNSSIPPSQDWQRKYPKREKSERKSGGQPGHEGHHHPFVDEPDKIEAHYPETCENCGSPDIDPLDQYNEARQEVELPPLKPQVTEHRRHAGRCRHCGKVSRGKFPDRLKAPVQMGESLTSLIGYLKYAHHLSHERIVGFFDQLFNLSVSEGFVENRLETLQEELTPDYDALRKAITQEKVVGSDETGQRVNGKRRYLWVFQSKRFCYFVGDASRKFDVIREIFGETFEGNWVSDRFSAQQKLKAKHQDCTAHVLRDLAYAIEADEDKTWATSMQCLIREAIHYRKEQGEAFDPDKNQDVFWECEGIRRRMAALFEKPPPPSSQQSSLEEDGKKKRQKTASERLFGSLSSRQESMLLFLRDPEVPYDNNASERALRHPKIAQKVLGPRRTSEGAKRQSVFGSVFETAKLQGLKILDVFSRKARLQFT
jgi:transposase